MGLFSGYLASRRYAMVAEHVRGDVLELGCGGHLIDRLRDRAASYTGVERSAERVRKLSERFTAASFVQCDLDRDPIPLERRFDTILMVALIEHLFNQQFVMAGVAALLKPKGKVVITTPTPFGNDVVHRAAAVFGLVARTAVDDHIVLYNRKRFRILAGEVGLSLEHHRYFQLGCNQIAILSREP